MMHFASSSLVSGKIAFLPRQDMLKWCRVVCLNVLLTNLNAFVALKSDGSVVTWGYSSFGGDSSLVSDLLNP